MRPVAFILIGPQHKGTLNNLAQLCPAAVYQVRQHLFGTLKITCLGNEGFLAKFQRGDSKDLLTFYNKLLTANPELTLVTIRSEGKPLPPTWPERIISFFHEKRFVYTEINGNGVGLPEIGIEVFGRECLHQLAGQAVRQLPDDRLNALSLENSKPCWPTPSEVEFYLVDHFHDFYRRPTSVNIEISSACNLSCSKCMYHSPQSPYALKSSENKIMEPEAFRRIVDRIADEFGTDIALSPTIRGEFLMNPNALSMLQYAAGKGFSISVFTNGQLFTPEIFRRLGDVGVMWINFSLDSIDPAQYRTLQGAELSKVMSAIEDALAIRGKNTLPILGVHFVEGPQNKGTFSSYYQYWKTRTDSVYHSSWCDVEHGFKSFLSPLRLPYRYPCLIFWKNLYINAESKAFVCGIWHQSGYPAMDLEATTLEALWTGPLYGNARRKQLGNDLDTGLALCHEDTSWGGSYSYKFIEDGMLTEPSMCGTSRRRYSPPTRLDRLAWGIKKKLNDFGMPDARLLKAANLYYKLGKQFGGHE